MREEESRLSKRRRKPATTPEERENQLISDALSLAERQIADGSVSAQVLTHFLKQATEKTKLEQKKLEADTQLALAKVEATELNKRLEDKYDKALDAMRKYSGNNSDEDFYEGP